jgi:hypothetical protein
MAALRFSYPHQNDCRDALYAKAFFNFSMQKHRFPEVENTDLHTGESKCKVKTRIIQAQKTAAT